MGPATRLLATAALLALFSAALSGCSLPRVIPSPTVSLRSSPPATAVPSAAPTVTRLPATASAGPAQELPASSEDEMSIMLSEDAYDVGETITFTITNHSDQALYYLYGGCTWPTIRRLERGDWVAIVVNRTDEFPGLTELAPGENRVCSWDQRAWQDLDKEGPARYRFYLQLAPVPPGRYHLAQRYYADPSDAQASENAKIARSRIFSIE